MDRERYKTDLTDEQWDLIKGVFPPEKTEGRRRSVSRREIINAIFYANKAGCPWELLPHDLPHYKTVHDNLMKWKRDGTLQKIHDLLRDKYRESRGRKKSPSAAIIDSQSVKIASKKKTRRKSDSMETKKSKE